MTLGATNNQVSDSATLYAFSGYITNRVLDGIAAGIEDVLPHCSGTKKSYRKVFGIFVELAQNIIYYSSKRVDLAADEAGFGVLEIAEDGTDTRLSASNQVRPEQQEKLIEIFAQIDGCTPEQISSLYKQRMIDTFDDPDSRGGGLGYFDIARKSVRPVQYHFETTADGHITFHISAWV